LQKLRKLAEDGQKSGQQEVCGLILSQDGFRLKLAFLRNQASGPGEFLIRRTVYKSAVDRAKRDGETVLGTFHSHPVSEAVPGHGDIKRAISGSLMLIYDVCGRKVKLWRVRKKKNGLGATELTLQLVEGTHGVVLEVRSASVSDHVHVRAVWQYGGVRLSDKQRLSVHRRENDGTGM
jgi:proteasome lid subunit RPN8/RPN11